MKTRVKRKITVVASIVFIIGVSFLLLWLLRRKIFFSLANGVDIASTADRVFSYVFTYEVVLLLIIFAVIITVHSILKTGRLFGDESIEGGFLADRSETILFRYDTVRKEAEIKGNTSGLFGHRVSKMKLDAAIESATLIHSDDKFVVDELKNLVKNGNGRISSEIRIRNTEGDYFWCRVNADAVRNENGKVINIVGSLVNVNGKHEVVIPKKGRVDSLTGLPEYDYTRKLIEELISQKAEEDVCALYIVDLNSFRTVNDKLGHAMGNRVLQDVSKKLCSIFNDDDIVGRIKGDMFLVFMKLTGEGIKVSDRIIESKARALCSKLSDSYSNGADIVKLSVSVGASVLGKDGDDFDSIYKKADASLYAAKQSGRGSYVIYDGKY